MNIAIAAAALGMAGLLDREPIAYRVKPLHLDPPTEAEIAQRQRAKENWVKERDAAREVEYERQRLARIEAAKAMRAKRVAVMSRTTAQG